MAGQMNPRARNLRVEELEPRLVNSASPGLQESFDATRAGALPSGWAQWSSTGTASFGVSGDRPLSGSFGLGSSGASNTTARTWLSASQPADVQVSASLYVDSLIPGQVLLRGRGLDTSNPTYYSVAVTRGLKVQLVRVVNGASAVLGEVSTASWLEGRWMQVTLSAAGQNLKVQVYRPDTRQYLTASGQWQSAQAWVMERTDGVIGGGGLAGLARAASYGGNVAFDDFSVGGNDASGGGGTSGGGAASGPVESFDSAIAGALPPGWSRWSSDGSLSFGVSSSRSLSGSSGLASGGSSAVAARAWLSAAQPANLQVSASVFADGLIPGQVLLRGRSLDGNSPTYYAASVTRGLKVQLLRVVNGSASVLGELSSASWLEGRWVQVTLSAAGESLRVQVYRADTRQYLSASGQWQPAQAWALERTDGVIGGGGLAGLARAASYSGPVTFDDFSVVAFDGSLVPPPSGTSGPQETFDRTPAGTVPAGWSRWSSDGSPSFAVSTARSLSGSSGLASAGSSAVAARAWLSAAQPANLQVAASVFADGLIPGQVLLRGRGLDGNSPTYYAASVTRGLKVQLLRVVNGSASVLGELSSASWLEGRWVQVTLSAAGESLRVQVYRADTRQYLSASGQWQSAQAWALERTDGVIGGGGLAGLARAASYSGSVTFDDFGVTPLANTPPPAGGGTTPSNGLTIPRHYQHIRLAELAYSGTPLGAFEDQLLRNSVDLVITDTPYLSEHIDQVSPNTPQLSYINYSSVYQNLLTDWLSYADAKGLSRESAFYHVRSATPFSGDSPSSQPVSWFWRVYRGGLLPTFQDFTTQAHIGGEDFDFGGLGESTYLAYPEKFREINLNLSRNAGGGWAAFVEYPTAVDAFGNPTAWGVIRATANSTAGLTRSGQIVFDPPADWKPVSLNGSELFYYVRLRTISAGQPPVASTILGRDFVGARGGSSGVIPAFDAAADLNNDGYLSDAEYGRRSPGKDARFAYESRLFYGSYGQQRYATNPASATFRAWAVDYARRYLAGRPSSDGLFVDNSGGDSLIDTGAVFEPSSTYSVDYGSLLAAVGQAIAPRWVLANTSGAGVKADDVVRQNTAYFEEFALRPLAHNWQNFESLAATLQHRATLRAPAPYAVLDSLPVNGSPTDPRTQIATLAYYYLVADPNTTFLNFNGGYEPSTAWSRHWSAAAAFDVGRPTGGWSLFASGSDPNDFRLGYRVYQRAYANALVLYKPVSTNVGGYTNGSVSDNTATWHNLNGSYRPLRADGTLGPAVTGVSLRNGEGVLLVKA